MDIFGSAESEEERRGTKRDGDIKAGETQYVNEAIRSLLGRGVGKEVWRKGVKRMIVAASYYYR
jgi:hypothetical protein